MISRSTPKESVLAIERMLSAKPQSAKVLIDRLRNEYGIERERKSIYQDIAVLTMFMPIEYAPRKGYYIADWSDYE